MDILPLVRGSLLLLLVACGTAPAPSTEAPVAPAAEAPVAPAAEAPVAPSADAPSAEPAEPAPPAAAAREPGDWSPLFEGQFCARISGAEMAELLGVDAAISHQDGHARVSDATGRCAFGWRPGRSVSLDFSLVADVDRTAQDIAAARAGRDEELTVEQLPGVAVFWNPTQSRLFLFSRDRRIVIQAKNGFEPRHRDRAQVKAAALAIATHLAGKLD